MKTLAAIAKAAKYFVSIAFSLLILSFLLGWIKSILGEWHKEFRDWKINRNIKGAMTIEGTWRDK